MTVNTTLMIRMAITAITTPAIVPIKKYICINRSIEMYFVCVVIKIKCYLA